MMDSTRAFALDLALRAKGKDEPDDITVARAVAFERYLSGGATVTSAEALSTTAEIDAALAEYQAAAKPVAET